MKEVNVDLLIIGDLACTTYTSCTSKGSITCGANLVEITALNIPDYIDIYGIRFHLNNAIVIDAKGGYVNATSTFAPDGKHIFATGNVCSRGIDVKDKYMTMETTDYVSYPIALALKKAGFDWKCDHYWYKVYTDSDKMEMRQASADDYNNDDWSVPHCSAPHIYQAQKWLREKKGYVISIHPESKFFEKTYKHTGWNYSIILISKTGIMSNGPIGNILVEKYEQALSAGIEAALELIEKKGE